MNTKLTRTFCLAFILLVELAASAWFILMEPYYEQVGDQWSVKARINPYFAAQNYLQRTGQDVYTTQKLSQIESLSINKTLFISHAGQVVSHKHVDRLLDWMRKGGHIIVAAQQGEQNDPLLSRFSITKFKPVTDESTDHDEQNDEQNNKQNNDREAQKKGIERAIQEIEKKLKEDLNKDKNTPIKDNSDTQALDEPENCADECQTANLTVLAFEGIDHEFNIDFSPSAGLLHPYINGNSQDAIDEWDADFKPIYWEYDNIGLQFVQFNMGDGLLTVLASDNIWNNNNIQEYDHAYLLSILTNASEQVVVLYGSQMPHIFVLLWQNAPELVISGGALLIMCLWFAGQRFGPVLTQLTDQRRSFNEHLLASGDFFWRNAKQSHLLQILRDDIIKTIDKNTVSNITSSEEKVCDYLQQRSPYSPQDIHQALYEQSHYKERDFTTMVRRLQELRHTL